MGTMRHFIRDNRGATLIETTFIVTLLILMTLGFVDLARAFAQWNTAEKATQIGVRAAIITDPVAATLATYDCGDGSLLLGTPCIDSTTTFGTITCSGSSSSCTSGNFNSTAFTTILNRMQVVYPQLTASDVVVEYSDVKLGFIGREGAVPAVTVRLTGIQFNFLILNSLLGLSAINMPSFSSTLIGEDLTAAGRA